MLNMKFLITYMCILYEISQYNRAAAILPNRLKPRISEARDLDEIDFLNAKQFSQRANDDSTQGSSDALTKAGKFEGDINLGGLPIQSKVNEFKSGNPRIFGNRGDANVIGRGNTLGWSWGEIPYKIVKDFGPHDRSVIAAAINEFTEKTCIVWKPRTDEKDYVFFTAGQGCFSDVGRMGGEQVLSIGRGCLFKGILIHEMMHAIGFFHEQSRIDRDDYVTINWDNIQQWAIQNFDKYRIDTIDDLGVPYDYDSIMHYKRTDFGKDDNSFTIKSKRGNHRLGQRQGLSHYDAKKINLLYQCRATGTRNKSVKSKVDCVNSWFDPKQCDEFASWGNCLDHRKRGFMGEYCAKSCMFCGDCKNLDKDAHCEFYKTLRFCTNKHKKYTAYRCMKTCDNCL